MTWSRARTDVAVSVVMPVYNTPVEWLDKAVTSILRQRCSEPIELVICDDASHGATRWVIDRIVQSASVTRDDITITLVRHATNLGPAAARNTAAREARGRYLLWLDSDDQLPDGTIEGLLNEADRTGASLTLSRCIVKDQSLTVERDPDVYVALARRYRGTPNDPLAQVIFSVQAQLMGAAVFDRLGGFDPIFRWGEVSDLFLRFAAASVALTDLAILSQPGYIYNRRPGSLSCGKYRVHHERARQHALRRYARACLHTSAIEIDDIVHIGRSPVSGAQHYQLITTSGGVRSVYHDQFFPAG